MSRYRNNRQTSQRIVHTRFRTNRDQRTNRVRFAPGTYFYINRSFDRITYGSFFFSAPITVKIS